MIEVEFKPISQVVGVMPPTASVEQIEKEVMLRSASPEFAREHGGVLTNRVLDVIESRYRFEYHKHYVIDTKSVMLMPGMYPAIPGWHCDGVIRNHQFAQPDLTKLNPSFKYCTVLVSSHHEGVSNTEFMQDTLVIPCDEERVWSSVNEYIESLQNKNTFSIQDGDILEFSQATLHRTQPAFNQGWRFFFRLSEYHMPPVNKIRHQVQVYASPASGW